MRVLGIDPGLRGALAIWNGRELEVADVPIMKARARGNEINIPAVVDILRSWFAAWDIDVAYVERNSVRPREGISSAHKNGITTGVLLGCSAVYCRNIVRPTPHQWKKALGLTSDKDYSRTKAIEQFPDYHELFARKKDDGRAEAALLAYYGFTCEIKTRRRRLGDG